MTTVTGCRRLPSTVMMKGPPLPPNELQFSVSTVPKVFHKFVAGPLPHIFAACVPACLRALPYVSCVAISTQEQGAWSASGTHCFCVFVAEGVRFTHVSCSERECLCRRAKFVHDLQPEKLVNNVGAALDNDDRRDADQRDAGRRNISPFLKLRSGHRVGYLVRAHTSNVTAPN